MGTLDPETSRVSSPLPHTPLITFYTTIHCPVSVPRDFPGGYMKHQRNNPTKIYPGGPVSSLESCRSVGGGCFGNSKAATLPKSTSLVVPAQQAGKPIQVCLPFSSNCLRNTYRTSRRNLEGLVGFLSTLSFIIFLRPVSTSPSSRRKRFIWRNGGDQSLRNPFHHSPGRL